MITRREALACIAVGMASIALAACTPETPEQKAREEQERVDYNASQSKLVTIIDGCRIWEVYVPHGNNPYFARCPEGAAPTVRNYMSGKVSKQNYMLAD